MLLHSQLRMYSQSRLATNVTAFTNEDTVLQARITANNTLTTAVEQDVPKTLLVLFLPLLPLTSQLPGRWSLMALEK